MFAVSACLASTCAHFSHPCLASVRALRMCLIVCGCVRWVLGVGVVWDVGVCVYVRVCVYICSVRTYMYMCVCMCASLRLRLCVGVYVCISPYSVCV